MISVEDAMHILRDNLPEPRTETIALERAYSRYLASDVCSPEPSPRFTNSAMDGYAVRWEDVQPATPEKPVVLDLVGESQAGIPFDRQLVKGQAIRISTGAVLPEGADTVVRVEDTAEQERCVQIFSTRSFGQDVRKEGEEFRAGDLLLQKGSRIGTRHLALLASVGIRDIEVFTVPCIALLITGTELVADSETVIQPFQIRDSNRVMLTCAVNDAGGTVTGCRHAGDDLRMTVETLDQIATGQPDVILCSGGVSVGRHDHVKKAAGEVGFTELFWRIRQKPGKPLFAARKKNMLLFGLPGNPVSAFMCYSHYVLPIISFLHGQGMSHQIITAQSPGEIANTGKRTNFLRVAVDFPPGEIPQITEYSKQGSHMLSSVTNADGYIILEPGERLPPGGLREVYLFQ